jgi:uncharacterized surface protein with fasciclin (FAS1) repeats
MNFQSLLKMSLAIVAFGYMCHQAQAQTNVFDDVIATSPAHTYLKAALEQENLDAVLQDGTASYTVFAPTNDAFDDLAAALNTNIAGILALNNLSDILTYHVLGSEVLSSAIVNGAVVDPLNTANNIKMTVTGSGDVYANHSMVSGADLTTDNGVVHSMDAVLLADETVIDVAIDNGFSTLVTAVTEKELVPTLINPLSEFTVFAPTNAAFDDLADALGTDINGLLALSNLSDILTYHVIGSEVDASAITNGDVVDAVSTTNTLKLTKTSNGDVYVNQAQVTMADVDADNGIVHVLDAVVLPYETVVDVALDNGFSTLATAVITAELLPALTDPLAELTVFAPTNDAFDALATELNTDISGILALSNLGDILTYHVLSSEVGSSAINNGDVVSPLSSTNTLKLSATAAGDVFVNQAQVTSADIAADNGLVHVLDAVVLPNETVVDVAIDNGFSSLTTAVITAELLSTLSDPFAEYTVFAPTNEAFDSAAANLGTDINGLLELETLGDILLYHVVSGTVLSTALSNGDVPTLNGLSVTVDLMDGVMINTASVTLADVSAENGVVHVIDQVLLPIPLSVEEVQTIQAKVYPNPTTDFVRMTDMINANYRIFNASGSMIESGTIMNNMVEVQSLPNGIYTIMLDQDGQQFQSRFVKQ